MVSRTDHISSLSNHISSAGEPMKPGSKERKAALNEKFKEYEAKLDRVVGGNPSLNVESSNKLVTEIKKSRGFFWDKIVRRIFGYKLDILRVKKTIDQSKKAEKNAFFIAVAKVNLQSGSLASININLKNRIDKKELKAFENEIKNKEELSGIIFDDFFKKDKVRGRNKETVREEINDRKLILDHLKEILKKNYHIKDKDNGDFDKIFNEFIKVNEVDDYIVAKDFNKLKIKCDLKKDYDIEDEIFDKIFNDFLESNTVESNQALSDTTKIEFNEFFFKRKQILDDDYKAILSIGFNKELSKGLGKFKKDAHRFENIGPNEYMIFDIKDDKITYKKIKCSELEDSYVTKLYKDYDVLINSRSRQIKILEKLLKNNGIEFDQSEFFGEATSDNYFKDLNYQITNNVNISEEEGIYCTALLIALKDISAEMKEIAEVQKKVKGEADEEFKTKLDESIENIQSYMKNKGIDSSNIEKYKNLIYYLFSQSLELNCVMDPIIHNLTNIKNPIVSGVNLEKGSLNYVIGINENKNFELSLMPHDPERLFDYTVLQGIGLVNGKMNIKNPSAEYAFKLNGEGNWEVKSGEVTFSLKKKSK